MAEQVPIIWTGTSSFSPGQTPFGFYDNESQFKTDADKVAEFCATRLGYPTVDIEMGSGSLYACFEEAVTTYGNELYLYQIRNNFITLEAYDTGSSLNRSVIQPNLGNIIRIAEDYGSEAGAGGYIDWYSGSVKMVSNQQDYDLNEWKDSQGITGSIEIKRVFYENTPAIVRYFDPYAGTGYGSQQLLDVFGFGNYSPAINFLLMPIYYDVSVIQAIELNDTIRKSAFSFELINNQLKIFPIPKEDGGCLRFQYILVDERNSPVRPQFSGSNLVTDMSTVPYENPDYNFINAPGRYWIFEYTLALAKELLGYIRGKYSQVPIPGAEVTLNQDALLSSASDMKAALIEKLRADLDENSRRNQLQRKAEEATAMATTLDQVPIPIYIA
jgi:hypothetical protein|tara:strand:+ start:142 stop:1299 length:1158 start_codon:yes stop_codon:yes gene_type:complete